MDPLELWPDDFEGGDAIIDGTRIKYLRAIDAKSGRSAVMFFTADAWADLIAKIAAGRIEPVAPD